MEEKRQTPWKMVMFLIAAVITLAPILLVLDINTFLKLGLIVFIFIPGIGEIVEIVVWIWAFVVAVQSEVTGAIIIFYITLGLQVIWRVAPLIYAAKHKND